MSYFRVLRLPFLGDIQVDISKPTSLNLIFHAYLPEYKQQLTQDSVLQAQTSHIQRQYRWMDAHIPVQSKHYSKSGREHMTPTELTHVFHQLSIPLSYRDDRLAC